jgi:MoaA/NifB/PqqE/SkfB family radical SAM enzyme
MRCQHCGDDVWGDPANDLTFSEIEKFSAGLGKLHEIALGGGEPFLRSDLPEICELFVKNNGVRNLTIPTNGFDTPKICAAVEKILQKNDGINLGLGLSLDGFQPLHDEIRMPGSFNRVMETADRFSTLRDKYSNFNFQFNATINSKNFVELPKLAKFVHDRFRTNLDFNLLSGNPRDPGLTLPPQNDLEKTVSGILASYGSSPLESSRLKVYQDIILRTNAEGRQIVPCRAASIIVMVDANGDVRSCPLLPVLGNLRNETFQNIWHGKTSKSQHKLISHGGCACNYDCLIVSSLSYYWKLPGLVLQQRLKDILSNNQSESP